MRKALLCVAWSLFSVQLILPVIEAAGRVIIHWAASCPRRFREGGLPTYFYAPIPRLRRRLLGTLWGGVPTKIAIHAWLTEGPVAVPDLAVFLKRALVLPCGS